jgi:hypothetical protein
VAMHVIRGAGNNLVLPAALVAVAVPVPVTIPATIPATSNRKISPATVVDPDSPVIRAPTVPFAAWRLATLLH